MKKDVLRLYLQKVILFCQSYDAFSIPAAMMVGGDIKLSEIYTHLSLVTKEEYEKPFSDEMLNGANRRLFSSIPEEEMDEDFPNRVKSKSFMNQPINQEKEQKRWKWILSSPGGGKTTLLKMYCLAYAYQYYIKVFGSVGDFLNDKDCKSIEEVCALLNINLGACPIFITVRELSKENYPSVATNEGFSKIIHDTVTFFVGDELPFNEEVFVNYDDEKVYLIDGVEEFLDAGFRRDFLTGLEAFCGQSRCYLSSRYREYNENVKTEEVSSLPGEEFVIRALHKDLIKRFAEKWYKALNASTTRKKLDVDKDFLIPLYRNKSVGNLIMNPLELTSLLMISSYDTCLPSSPAKIYERSLELWISWNNTQYNYEDIMRQLSRIAYMMGVSKNEKLIIRYKTIEDYVRLVRIELKRYFHQEWETSGKAIGDFIQFLTRCNILSKFSENCYTFIHRQYHAYLIAYCVSKNNFSRNERKDKPDKFDFIREWIKEKDPFWNEVFKMCAMIDIDLRDKIIETFNMCAREANRDTSYYVSFLLELSTLSGINFDENEYRDLIDLFVHQETNWNLFWTKKVVFQEFLILNSKETNEYFLETVLKKHKELTESDQDKFRDKIATSVFYCIWNCSVEERYIEDVMYTFFADHIRADIVDMLFNDFSKGLNDNQKKVKEIVYSIGKKEIAIAKNDCLMIHATMKGYEEMEPFSCVNKLISEKTHETDLIAIHLLVVAAWLIRCDEARRYGFHADDESLSKYVDFVLNGIVEKRGNSGQFVYLTVFDDSFENGYKCPGSDVWFRRDVFEEILRDALSDFEKKGVLFDEKNTCFKAYFEHIAFYPFAYRHVAKKVAAEFSAELIDLLLERISHIHETSPGIIVRLFSLKLLFFLGKDTDHVIKSFEAIAHGEAFFTDKFSLRDDDCLKTYERLMDQVKDLLKKYNSKR